ncbi:MAG: crotonase/enoyl-CoA hydratase family protein [Acidimicrobiia bacterium]|nr:crotonase/enoyl-CoA hydratase family protein [Acidimicrobiia bacterium]
MSVLTELNDGALVLTINRPNAGNSLNPEVGQGLVDAFDEAENNPEVRAVIVTGAGEKIFSAGMDLKAFAAGEDMAPVGRGIARLVSFPKPVIAAVNGMALAGGFEVMMKCDLIVAAEHAVFGIPEVTRGLVAAGGGTRLPRRLPLQIALELGLTGQPISAERAYHFGLVNRLVPADQVLPTALELAAVIGRNGPLAVAATKQLMHEEMGEDTAKRVREVTAPVFVSEDAKEGATAFAEKRPPVWKGR